MTKMEDTSLVAGPGPGPGPEPGSLAELRVRLEKAAHELQERRDEPFVGMLERRRLAGKVEGVKLALSYVHDAERVIS